LIFLIIQSKLKPVFFYVSKKQMHVGSPNWVEYEFLSVCNIKVFYSLRSEMVDMFDYVLKFKTNTL